MGTDVLTQFRKFARFSKPATSASSSRPPLHRGILIQIPTFGNTRRLRSDFLSICSESDVVSKRERRRGNCVW